MKRVITAAALVCALLLVAGAGVAGARPEGKPAPAPVTVQILNVSDWHGYLDPTGGNGGAWNLSARWQADRQAYPTLTLTAGDDIGASPALSSFFDEVPAVKAQRMMGIQVGALGNHNFDRGIAHLQRMIDLAGAPTSADAPGSPYRYVSANLRNVEENLSGVDPVAYFDVGGAKVAVIGITNEEAPGLVLPGAFGTIEVTDGVAAANKFAGIARKAKADAVVVITHKGVRGTRNGEPFGELIDFANALDSSLVDVVVGDHTDFQYSGTVNDILVHENRSYGQTYAKTLLTIQPGGPGKAGSVTNKSVSFVAPAAPAGLQNGNTTCPATAPCDQAIVDMLVPYRQQLSQLLDGKIATASGTFVRGGNIERRQEVPLGDLIADGMRWRYNTQLGLMNGGGIRAPMPTCGYSPVDTSLKRPCAGYASGTPYDVVLGDVFAILPFGNILNTRTVTGIQLWQALENGVSRIAADGMGGDGRFPQISGFKFTFDYSKPTGCGSPKTPGQADWTVCVPSRVTSVSLADGTAIPYANTLYTIALPNFVNLGGDSYFMFADGQGATQELDAVVMTEYLKANGPNFDPASYPLDRITKVG